MGDAVGSSSRGGGGGVEIQKTVVTGGAERIENNVNYSNRSYFWRGPCPRLEHHHLMIWTHLTDWWPELTTTTYSIKG